MKTKKEITKKQAKESVKLYGFPLFAIVCICVYFAAVLFSVQGLYGGQ